MENIYYRPHMEIQTTLGNLPVQRLPKLFEKHETDKILFALQNPRTTRNDDIAQWLIRRNVCIFMLSKSLATRAKELLCCKIEDLDIKTMTIYIRPESNKTGKGRTLQIPPEAWKYIHEYLACSHLQYWKFSPYLFPTLHNEKLSSDRWQEIFRQAQEDAGVYRPRRGTHALRHTKLTDVYIKTKDPEVVKQIAGWNDYSMMPVYVHLAAHKAGYGEYIRSALSEDKPESCTTSPNVTGL